MAADLNKCCFIGRLGRDVELKDLNNGEQMATFSIAVGESYMSKMGEKVKKTEWVNIVAYRKLAEICYKYLTKGSQVYISGKLHTNKYTGKDGTEKKSVQIILDQMQMLGGRSNQENTSTETSVEEEVDVPF
jgi:single-strand DNA-binding protein